MQRREAKFQILFNHWLKEYFKGNGCFELKDANGKALPFNSVEEHQINSLLMAKHKSLVFKIPDCGFRNPFDCIQISGCDSFVVVKYDDSFMLIDIDDFVNEQKISDRKSLTKERAYAIAKKVIKI